MVKISGLNYDAVLASEDYAAYRKIIEEEIITRFKMGSGFPWKTAEFGILDSSNPSIITTGETSRPLLVMVSNQSEIAVALNPGYALAPNGTIFLVDGYQEKIILADTVQAGKTYAVVLESRLNSSAGSTSLNDYQEPQSTQELVYTAIASYIYVSGWLPSENQTVLAMVKAVDKTGGGLELQIDMTQNTYAFNRPWFSIVDTKHRAQIGSGTVTDTNPHATSFNDLTLPGSVGLMQGIAGVGIVLSRDKDRNKMAGAKYCQDTISYANLKIDTSGTITANSPYGKPNAFYAELTSYPLRLGSVYEVTSPARAIAAEVLPGTNIIVFGPNEALMDTQSFIVEYTTCSALSLPITTPTNLLTFGGTAGDQEAILSGGYIYPVVPDPTISFEGTGPFARRYRVYLMGDGVLRSYPEIVVSAQSTSSSISSFTPTYPSRISVGITNTTGSSSLLVTVVVSGTRQAEYATDSSAVTSETLTFSPATGYLDQTIPAPTYDLAGQILTTIYKYTEISAISITTVNAGTNPLVQVWAEVEPGMTPELNDVLPIAEVFWNGNGIPKLLDIRNIQKHWHYLSEQDATSELESLRILNLIKSGTLLTNKSTALFTENFEDLKYFDSKRGYMSPTKATGLIGFNSSKSLITGDTITLTTSPVKQLLAVTSGATTGQFAVGSSLAPITLSTLIQNFITAVNDPIFDSKVVASLSTTNPLNVALELQTPVGNVANQITMTATTSTLNAVVLSGFNFAVDGYGECYFDRDLRGLTSSAIPTDLDLNPYKQAYRKRYRSRAISLPVSLGSKTKFAIQLLGEDQYVTSSVRIRGSKFNNSANWEGWNIASPETTGIKGLYVFNFPIAVHKVQVEVYSKARGVTLYVLEA